MSKMDELLKEYFNGLDFENLVKANPIFKEFEKIRLEKERKLKEKLEIFNGLGTEE